MSRDPSNALRRDKQGGQTGAVERHVVVLATVDEDRFMLFRPPFLSALALLAFVPLALAHEGATGVVKERMDLMDTQKEAMKVMGAMAKGTAPFDAAKAKAAAQEIEDTAKKIPELFPEGTGGHPSEAKPEVWTKWDEFTADAEGLESAAADLILALEAPEAPEWKAKFKGVIDACKTCHKTFRMEDE
jgi:cytochrome c556